MKKVLIYCILFFTIASCSLDGDNTDYPDHVFEFVPIETVQMPNTFNLGEVYTIDYTYSKPTTCHAFHDLYYDSENNIRTIAVVDIVYTETNCDTLENNVTSRAFNFKATNNGSYIFKFWQGEDSSGEDIYLTYEVEVID